MAAVAAEEHIDRLGRELRCSICLNLMSTPVARLPCCHYFCQSCVTESVRHRPQCPICKAKVSRRDIALDETMDRVVQAFQHLDEHKGTFLTPLDAEDRAGRKNAICWLRGVDDAEFNSPSKSMSASAIEQMRRQAVARRQLLGDTPQGGGAIGAKDDKDNKEEEHEATSAEKGGVQKKQVAGGDSLQNDENNEENNNGTSKRNANKRQSKRANNTATGGKGKKVAAADEKDDGEAAAAVEKEKELCSPPVHSGGAEAAAAAVDNILAGLQTEGGVEDTSDDETAPLPRAGAKKSLGAGGLNVVVDKPKQQQRQPAAAVEKRKSAVAGPAAGVVKLKVSAAKQKRPGSAKADAKNKKSEMGGKQQQPPSNNNIVASEPKKQTKRRSSGPVAVTTPVDADGNRRIPTRLLPWACGLCTFENKGGAPKCTMCDTVKGPNCRVIYPDEAMEEAAPQQGAAGTNNNAAGKTVAKEPTTTAAKKRKAQTEAAAVTGATKQAKSAKPARKSAAIDKEQQKQQEADKPVAKPAAGKKKAQTEAATTAEEVSTDQPVANNNNNTSQKKAKTAHLVLLGSALSSESNALLKQVAAAAGGSVADNFNSRVTHIVCGTTGPDDAARRTFKYLMGILSGKPVVSDAWLKACIEKNADNNSQGGFTPVDVGEFMVEKDAMGVAGGARLASAALELGAGPLLAGCEVQLQGEFANKGQVCDLIRAAGGKLITRLPSAANTTTAAGTTNTTKLSTRKAAARGKKSTDTESQLPERVVLCEAPDESEAALAGFKASIAEEAWFARAAGAGVPVASFRWLTDSISAYIMQPIQGYLL